MRLGWWDSGDETRVMGWYWSCKFSSRGRALKSCFHLLKDELLPEHQRDQHTRRDSLVCQVFIQETSKNQTKRAGNMETQSSVAVPHQWRWLVWVLCAEVRSLNRKCWCRLSSACVPTPYRSASKTSTETARWGLGWKQQKVLKRRFVQIPQRPHLLSTTKVKPQSGLWS